MYNFNRIKTNGLILLVSTVLGGCGGGAPVTSSSSITQISSSQTSQSVSSVSSTQTSSSQSSASSVATIPSGSNLVYAINAGGSATTVQGKEFRADRFSNGGSANETSDDIANTTADVLYQTERWGNYSYEIPVTNSSYSVVLHFVEMFHEAEASRYFSLSVEGEPLFIDLDLFAEVGHDAAFNTVLNGIMVADESLTIEISASLDNGTISAIEVYSNTGGEFIEPPPSSAGEHGFFVGNITTQGQVRSDFTQYWDQITPENEGKWGSVEGTRDQYNWGPVDRIYDFARQAGIPVKAHTLVWGAQRPGWIDGLSPSEQAAEIEEWIRDYCNRYPDTAIIDVVNEAHPNHAPANYAQSAFGNNWITRSFELARQYCPNSILVYNDFNFMTWDTDVILDLIRPAINAGVVDAVGVQAHSLYDPKVWSAQEIQDKLDLISTLGVPIYVSEYDIEATDDQTQLQYMQMHFPIFYNHPNVVGITLWGYVYGATWRTGTGLIRNGQVRPALTWLMNYLRDNPK